MPSQSCVKCLHAHSRVCVRVRMSAVCSDQINGCVIGFPLGAATPAVGMSVVAVDRKRSY